MRELTVVRAVRPGLWVAEAGGKPFLVREIPSERKPIYEAAQRLPLPIPLIHYVGPDAEHTRDVVVEELLVGQGSADGPQPWACLKQLAPRLRGHLDGLIRGLTRAVEAVAWLQAAGFLHGNLTPTTLLFQPRGGVCLAGLDCLQPFQGTPVPCVAYPRLYACLEQLEGWLHPTTDVRLLGLAFAEAYLGYHPLIRPAGSEEEGLAHIARHQVHFQSEAPVLRLLEWMTAVKPEDRPDLREVLARCRRL